MKQYKVQITDRALADMEEIYNYIAIQSQASELAEDGFSEVKKFQVPKLTGIFIEE